MAQGGRRPPALSASRAARGTCFYERAAADVNERLRWYGSIMLVARDVAIRAFHPRGYPHPFGGWVGWV